jgi:hypothetical protein
MKQAFQAVKAGQREEAVRLSQQNLQTCQSLPNVNNRTLGHAYNTVSLSHYTTQVAMRRRWSIFVRQPGSGRATSPREPLLWHRKRMTTPRRCRSSKNG